MTLEIFQFGRHSTQSAGCFQIFTEELRMLLVDVGQSLCPREPESLLGHVADPAHEPDEVLVSGRHHGRGNHGAVHHIVRLLHVKLHGRVIQECHLVWTMIKIVTLEIQIDFLRTFHLIDRFYHIRGCLRVWVWVKTIQCRKLTLQAAHRKALPGCSLSRWSVRWRAGTSPGSGHRPHAVITGGGGARGRGTCPGAWLVVVSGLTGPGSTWCQLGTDITSSSRKVPITMVNNRSYISEISLLLLYTENVYNQWDGGKNAHDPNTSSYILSRRKMHFITWVLLLTWSYFT